MNILILSAGTRNKIVQYFKKTLEGKGLVIATDCSDIAPALYDADKYYIVPRMIAPEYIDVVLGICKKEGVTGVLSLIDPELSLLAKHIEDFKAIGTTVIGSSYDLCEMSLDKMQMYDWLAEHHYNCAKSYTIPEGCVHNAHMFYIKCKDLETRQAYIKYMKDNDVLCTFHYVPLHSAPAGLKFGRFHGIDKYTTAESDRLVRLPMYYNITKDDLAQVIEKTLDFFENKMKERL